MKERSHTQRGNDVISYYDDLNEEWKRDLFEEKLDDLSRFVDDADFDEDFTNACSSFLALDEKERDEILAYISRRNNEATWGESTLED